MTRRFPIHDGKEVSYSKISLWLLIHFIINILEEPSFVCLFAWFAHCRGGTSNIPCIGYYLFQYSLLSICISHILKQVFIQSMKKKKKKKRSRIHCNSPGPRIFLTGTNLLGADDKPDVTQIRPKTFQRGLHYSSFSLAKPSIVHNWDYNQPSGSSSAMELHKASSQLDLDLQLRLVRSSARLLKAASLWRVCDIGLSVSLSKHTNYCPEVAHRVWPDLPCLSTQVLISKSVLSGCFFPWLLIQCPYDRSRNSVTQSCTFWILSLCRLHFFHTGIYSSLLLFLNCKTPRSKNY